MSKCCSGHSSTGLRRQVLGFSGAQSEAEMLGYKGHTGSVFKISRITLQDGFNNANGHIFTKAWALLPQYPLNAPTLFNLYSGRPVLLKITYWFPIGEQETLRKNKRTNQL
jgi:hypothetical protein